MFGGRKRIERAIERSDGIHARNQAAFEGMMAAFERNSEAFERNREAFERNGEAFERNIEAFDRNREVIERHRTTHEDLRAFTRDLTRRNELVWREVVTELRAGQKALADISDQVRANTQALLLVLDRFEDGGTNPA